MIFTYGHTESYERGLAEHGRDFKKLGKCILDGKPYGGGGMWRTAEEAEAYLIAERLTAFSVYVVLADWDADTEQLEGEPYRRLLRDAQIVMRADAVPTDA